MRHFVMLVAEEDQVLKAIVLAILVDVVHFQIRVAELNLPQPVWGHYLPIPCNRAREASRSPPVEATQEKTMARLNIEARGALTTSGDGVRIAVVVSVTDETGKPVTTLTATNFVVQAISVGADDLGVTVSAVTPRADGVYSVDLVPSTGRDTWRHGNHVLAVAIASGFARGQCLAELTVP
jgi:hypothetical protein